jgi:hypothetical protein
MPTLEPWIRTLNPIAFGSMGLQVPSDFGLVSLSNLKLLGSGRGYPTQVINIIIIIIIIIIITTTTTTTTTTIDFTFQIKSIFFSLDNNNIYFKFNNINKYNNINNNIKLVWPKFL